MVGMKNECVRLIVLLFCLILGLLFISSCGKTNNFVFAKESNDDALNIINVEVSGEVEFPGIYSVKPGTMVFEILKDAVLKKDADITDIMLVDKITENRLLFIPKLEKENFDECYKIYDCSNTGLTKIYVELKGDFNNPGIYILDIGTTIGELMHLSGGAKPGVKLNNYSLVDKLNDNKIFKAYSSNDETSSLINLNTATQADLETLPSVGPSLAERIINYRLEIGLFSSIEEIKNVKGIGESTYNKLKEFICV